MNFYLTPYSKSVDRQADRSLVDADTSHTNYPVFYLSPANLGNKFPYGIPCVARSAASCETEQGGILIMCIFINAGFDLITLSPLALPASGSRSL